MRSQFVNELESELGIPRVATYQRFSGDYTGGYGNSGFGAGGYTGGGYSNYGARARNTYVGKASSFGYGAKNDDEGYRTFGSGKPVGAGRSAPAHVRYGNAGATSAPKPAAPKQDASRFQVGMRVRHTRFGEGTVTAMRGAGSNVIVTVSFDQAGNKDLAAALAPLTIL